MHRRASRFLFYFALPAVLAMAVLSFGRAQPRTAQAQRRGPAIPQFLLRYAIPGTKDLPLVIELANPPVVQRMISPSERSAAAKGRAAVSAGRLRFDSAEALAHRNDIALEQKGVRDRLTVLSGVQVAGATDLVMNSILARVPIEQYLAVRQLPGVKKVYFSRMMRKNLNTAAVTQNAAALWSKVSGGRSSAGAGVKIGLIDTGIDINHPMFQDNSTALPAGFPKYDTVSDRALTNHKVIAARNYVTTQYGYNPESVNSAIDEDGHGSFVAGCAAGKLVTAPYSPIGQISGMAPAAFLGNYRVFGTPGTNDYAWDAAIIAAINDAVSDGMDVLNLSLGALDYVPPSEDPEITAINNAIAAGVVVVIAAGNSGPDTHTVSNPGGAPEAITVGAVSNAHVFDPQLHVTSTGTVPASLQNTGYAPSYDGPWVTAAIAATTAIDVSSLDGNGLSCSSLPAGSLRSKIALIERGQCHFVDKVTNASNAGARAVVVYDNILGESPGSMSGLGPTTIPAVMIANADGVALKNLLATYPATSISIDVSSIVTAASTTPDVVTSYSARGPAPDFGMKPDLMAVGNNVYSSTQKNYSSSLSMYDPSGYTVGSGTSFSTPMVSGAAAALIQLFPSLSPAGIKSALTNTTDQVVTTDGVALASVVQSGSGLLDMGNASAARAVFSPTNINFGMHEYSNSIVLTQTLVINNFGSSADQYTLSLQPLISGPSISLSQTSTGSVPSGGSTSVDVVLQATAPLTGGFQGFITVQSTQTSTSYAVPYWAGFYVPDPSRILAVSATGTGVYNRLADALADANPGNVIEIQDSQTYSLGDAGLIISTNAQGLPLHGITIRAAAGQTPILDGSTTSALADIQIVGLRNVLIQGLTINGGETGINPLQPSTTVPLVVTVDHCNIINQNASFTSSGIIVEQGGTLDITDSTISGSSAAGVAAVGGAYLTISNSTIQNSGAYSYGSPYYPSAIFGLDSHIDLISSASSGNLGTGAFLENCTGTFDGNTFTSNTGNFGDGIELGDGAFTVRNNTFSSNDLAGIYLFTWTAGSGSAVSIEKNIIQSNSVYGIDCDQSSSLNVVGNMITGNGLGIVTRGTTQALLINNIIARNSAASIMDYAQRNGVYADDSSTVALVNNTIYQNQLHGIVRASSAAISVVNTIISSSGGEDLQNLSAGDIQYSFIGDGTLAGGTNLQGDPRFVNPSLDDFRLATGSPAIDKGSNAAPNLPFLDYNGQLRVASASSLPGNGVVDMGALEAGSSYPLNYPLLVSGNNQILNNTFITGIAALNPSSTSSVQATFEAYDPNGALLSGSLNPTPPLIFSPETQDPILDFQLFGYPQGAAKVGAVLASSAQKMVGFFLIMDSLFAHLADGVDVSSDTYTDFYFPRHEYDASGKATYQLFNPGVNQANVTATLFDESGAQLDLPKTSILPPKGQFMFDFTSVTSSGGYVHVQSDRPITGLETWGTSAEIAALRAASAGSDTRLFFPHIAVNGGYSSLIGVVNTSASQADLIITAYANNGSILGTPAERLVNSGGQLLESASNLFAIGGGDLITGYVIAQSDQPGIMGFSAFDYDNGSVHSSAAVPAENMPRSKLLFSHIAHQVAAGSGGNYLTGIALLNPYGAAITYTLKVFDSSGTEVAEMNNVLGPHAKVAKLLSSPAAGAGFFTQQMPLSRGHIEVTTDYQLLGFEVFFTESLTQLAAVMAQFPN